MHPKSNGTFCDKIEHDHKNGGRGRGGICKSTHSKVYT